MRRNKYKLGFRSQFELAPGNQISLNKTPYHHQLEFAASLSLRVEHLLFGCFQFPGNSHFFLGRPFNSSNERIITWVRCARIWLLLEDGWMKKVHIPSPRVWTIHLVNLLMMAHTAASNGWYDMIAFVFILSAVKRMKNQKVQVKRMKNPDCRAYCYYDA